MGKGSPCWAETTTGAVHPMMYKYYPVDAISNYTLTSNQAHHLPNVSVDPDAMPIPFMEYDGRKSLWPCVHRCAI